MAKVLGWGVQQSYGVSISVSLYLWALQCTLRRCISLLVPDNIATSTFLAHNIWLMPDHLALSSSSMCSLLPLLLLIVGAYCSRVVAKRLCGLQWPTCWPKVPYLRLSRQCSYCSVYTKQDKADAQWPRWDLLIILSDFYALPKPV